MGSYPQQLKDIEMPKTVNKNPNAKSATGDDGKVSAEIRHFILTLLYIRLPDFYLIPFLLGLPILLDLAYNKGINRGLPPSKQ